MAKVRVVLLNSSMLSILETVGRLLQSLEKSPWHDSLELDLSHIRFLQADGVLALLSCARLWYRWTRKPTVLAKIPLEVHAYLERTNLFDAPCIAAQQRLAPEYHYHRSDQSHSLLEITAIAGTDEQNAHDVVQALDRARHVLTSWFDAPPAAFDGLLTIVAELTANITHSNDTGYIIVQRYLDTSHRRRGSRVTLAIADLGIGIEASLHTNPTVMRQGLSHGSDYLLAALQSGMTSRTDVGGVGLARVHAIVTRWQGELAIRSQSSMIRLVPKGITMSDELAPVPGTHITVTARGWLPEDEMGHYDLDGPLT